MCGLFATTRPDLWRALVPQLETKLHHRGPDAHGVWESPGGEVLMVHTRLSIIGLDGAGDQPARSRDGHVGLVFNGEIYNYRSFAQQIGDPDPRSDTAVLAELVDRCGPQAASRLRGMFAFVAWDQRTRTLTAVRDPYGIKPLYVLEHGGGGVSLCSEIPPLLLLPEARRVDPVGLAHYLAFGHTGASVTCFEAIAKVPPGTILDWRLTDHGNVQLRTSRLGQPPTSAVDLDEAMVDSVRSHLVSDVEVGIFLSGGIDSTLLAAVARELSPGLRTFTIAFPDAPGIDESAMAAANARLLGVGHTTIPVTCAHMVAAAPRFVEIHGEPFGDAAALPLTVLSTAVSAELKVVLTGEGADEMFGGYGRYRISRRVGHRAFHVTGVASRAAASWWGTRRGDRPWARGLEALAWGGGPRSHAALLGADVTAMRAAGVPFAEDVDTMARADWEGQVAPGRPEQEVARRVDLTRWLPNTYLEKTDRATMAASLEARVPYLDTAVARAAQRSPVDSDKLELRRCLERRLPGVVLPDRKKGLSVSLGQLLAGGLGAHARHELECADSVLRTWFGDSEVRSLGRRAQQSELTTYRLAMLGQWEATLSAAGLL